MAHRPNVVVVDKQRKKALADAVTSRRSRNIRVSEKDPQNTRGRDPQTGLVAPADSKNYLQDLCPEERSPGNSYGTGGPSQASGRGPELEGQKDRPQGVKVFSYSTSAASLFLMPQILLKTGLGVQAFALQVAYCGVIGFFTFLTPVLLHLITKGYVIRLYHNPGSDVYTAVTYNMFLAEKKSVFHQSQVKIPAVSKMFTSFYAGRVGLLVNPDMFPTPHDYNHLMGYDKPFSLSSDDLDQPDKS